MSTLKIKAMALSQFIPVLMASSIRHQRQTNQQGLDSTQIDIIRGHGCHCSRLDSSGLGNQEGFLASSPTADFVDQTCRDWIGTHTCVSSTGGSCNGVYRM